MESTLTVVETAKLENYEEIIESGLQTCFDVGHALLAIRDGKLYRADYGTFEEYCKERWNLARSRAYQYIEAATVRDNVQNFGQTDTLPANDHQARPLAKLPAAEQPAAWQEAVESSGGKPTGKQVEEVVNKRLGKTKAISLFVCQTCADTFNHEVWHCEGCGHHWPIEKQDCTNCERELDAGDDAPATVERVPANTPAINEEMASDVLYDDLCAVIEKHKAKWKFGREPFIDACTKAATFSKSLWRAKR